MICGRRLVERETLEVYGIRHGFARLSCREQPVL
jgi:hypothetical protein